MGLTEEPNLVTLQIIFEEEETLWGHYLFAHYMHGITSSSSYALDGMLSMPLL